jgi:hypothetical protein
VIERRPLVAGMIATAFVLAARVGRAGSEDRVLERLFAATSALVLKWQDAREIVGLQRGGVVGNMELRAGKYPGPRWCHRPSTSATSR